MEEHCFLCGRLCKKDNGYGQHYFFNRYRCVSCGDYLIDSANEAIWGTGGYGEQKKKISHLAAERYFRNKTGFILCKAEDPVEHRTNLGISWPYIEWETFLQDYPKDSIETLDRTLLNLAQLSVFPGKSFNFKMTKAAGASMPERSFAFSNDWGESCDLLFLLEMEGCIDFPISLKQEGTILTGVDREAIIKHRLSSLETRILPKGFQRIRELKSRAAGDHSQAFVAMWFDPSRNEFFDQMKRAALEAGFENCLRIDNKEHNNKICDEIIAEIRKSQCVIADFTGNRGGVYFEAGFALGLGIPVIWLVDAKHINDLHFDTRQYAHIAYEDGNDLYERLKARILATVPLKK